VPLYKRVDMFEYQIALLGQDPEIHEADLVFVLDSPELAESVDREARELHALYKLPFRLAVMNRNSGFANVNNAGASLARGRLLLLLNADVMPDRPGWLGRMVELHDSTPDVGALGPKLLYEDGSLQHAGMYFEWDPGAKVWENLHYFKGLDRDLPAASVTRTVPAVTGACMMVERRLYQSVGGLPHSYVQGGYEDSHFCLQLMEQGLRNRYAPEIELYHLEAQSYVSTAHRARYTRYNVWLQTMLWGDRLEALADEFRPRGDAD
jgi:GT2 family glycosyltransferase